MSSATTSSALAISTPTDGGAVVATSPSGAVVEYTVTNVDPLLDIITTCAPASGSVFPIGVTAVVCTSVDPAGNSSPFSQTVIVVASSVVDAPHLNLPGDATVYTTNPSGAVFTYAVSAGGVDELVDGIIPVACVPASGSLFPVGTTTVTCAAIDSHGNSLSGSFQVNVVLSPPVAPTALAISTPTVDGAVVATSPSGAVVEYTFADLDPRLTATCAPASGSVFPIGLTSVVCNLTDAAGNVTSASYEVRVVAPIVVGPPHLDLPGDATVYTTNPSGAVFTYAASAGGVAALVSCAPASGSLFPVGTTTVNCVGTDIHGNSLSGSFQVNVVLSRFDFLQPINLDGSSVFKLGGTLPVKFRLTGPSNGRQNLTARIFLAKLSNNISGSEQEAVSSSAADSGNLFRYSATDDLYIFNLATKALSAGTWQIRVDLGDGSVNTAVISLKR